MCSLKVTSSSGQSAIVLSNQNSQITIQFEHLKSNLGETAKAVYELSLIVFN